MAGSGSRGLGGQDVREHWSRTGNAVRSRGRRRLLVGVLCGALMVASGGVVAAAPVAGQQPDWHGGFQPPRIGHVWTIILENKSYEATFTGLNQNDYLWKTLPSYGELLRQYYGTGHYSLDNYISLVSGQAPTPDNQADCPQYKNVVAGNPCGRRPGQRVQGCVYPSSVQTLFNQLDAAHVSWKIYAQDMGNDPTRENAYQCGVPGDPAGTGVPDPGGATADRPVRAQAQPGAVVPLADRQPEGLRQRRAAGRAGGHGGSRRDPRAIGPGPQERRRRRRGSPGSARTTAPTRTTPPARATTCPVTRTTTRAGCTPRTCS